MTLEALRNVAIPTDRYSYYYPGTGIPIWFFLLVVCFFLYVTVRIYLGLRKERNKTSELIEEDKPPINKKRKPKKKVKE
jgi:hypothetical protein